MLIHTREEARRREPIDRALIGLAWATPLVVFCGVYGAAAGRGFISDDFRWILESRVAHVADILALFNHNNGFYRPLVSLTFALNEAAFGMGAAGYGYTNLALALVCAALLFRLCRALGLSAGAAAFAAAVWAFNFHGINMAILWISGRTALLLVVCSLAAAWALISGHRWTTLGFVALALFSKEEAVLLPVLLLALAFAAPEPPHLRRGRFLVPLVAGLVVELVGYAVLRRHAGAMMPSTAPPYYRFVFTPAVVARNVAEFADRACTFAAAASIVAWAILQPSVVAGAPSIRRSMLFIGAAWLVCGYAITIFLPVRSSLYACLPSVGAAIVAGECCGNRWKAAGTRQRRIALAATTAIAVALAPVYVARDRRWTDLATFSTTVLGQLAPQIKNVDPRASVVLIDEGREDRVNLQSAFGTLLADAVRLRTGKALSICVEPAGIHPMAGPCAGPHRDVFVVSSGAVVKRVASSQ